MAFVLSCRFNCRTCCWLHDKKRWGWKMFLSSRAALSRVIFKLLSVGLLTPWMRSAFKLSGFSWCCGQVQSPSDVIQKTEKEKLNNTHATTQKRARWFYVAVKTPFLPTCQHGLISALQSWHRPTSGLLADKFLNQAFYKVTICRRDNNNIATESPSEIAPKQAQKILWVNGF